MGVEVALTAFLTSAAIGAGTIGAPLALTGSILAGTAIGGGILAGGGLGANLLLGAAITGAQYALSKSMQKGRLGAGGINDPGVTGNTRQATPARRVVYGNAKVGGATFFLDDSKPPYLYLGLMLSSRRINNFLSVKIGTTEIQFDDLGNCVTTGYVGKIWSSFRDGDPDQAIDPLIHADFPNVDSSFRQRGIATAVFKFYYGADREEFESLWGNTLIPNPLITVEGCPVYDPRDPTQDRDDETTWKYTNNATLIQADWARQPYGVNAEIEQANWNKIKVSADYDDELVGLKQGGFQKRFTIDGVVTLDQSPKDVMEAMLTANRGMLVLSRGKWWLSSSRPREVVLTVHDGMVVGPSSFRGSKPLRDLVNKVSGTFIAPERDYQPADGPILQDDDEIEDDGQELAQAINLPFTLGNERFQRLQKAYKDEARLGKAINERLSLKALGLDIDSCIKRYSKTYSARDGKYIPTSISFTPDFSALDVQFVEYDPEINGNWNPAVDQQDFTLPPLDVS